MSSSSPLSPLTSRWLPAGNTLDSVCRGILMRKLAGLKHGKITVLDSLTDLGHSRVLGGSGSRPELEARIQVRHPRFYSRALLGGSIGVGESYVDGDWDCEDLTKLIQVFVANREQLVGLDRGWGALLSPIQKFAHRMRNNSLEGSRSNIHAHYDMGNDFFNLFLDETWMYSCGIYERADSTLLEASHEKNDRICRKLGLGAADHLVEIGTGWGGFAIHAARHYGCRVTTTTISKEQYDFAVQRVRSEGLEDRITLLFEDYRNLQGKFDKLVSIEMIEAVGLDHHDTYFRKCADLLKPSGSMLIQSITIKEQYYEDARRSVDFIQRHIFPGSGIPAVSEIVRTATGKTDLQLLHFEDIGPHYARTLHDWSVRLASRREEVARLDYPPHLNRLWQFYFSYCEGGFLERSISCGHLLFVKPEARKEPILGRLP